MKLLCAVCLAALFAALFCSPHILPEEADPPASAAVIAEFDAAGDSEKLFVIQNDPVYPARLVRFAEDYPQAIDYVYHYPARKDTFDETPLFAEAASDTPPLLFQWDAALGLRLLRRRIDRLHRMRADGFEHGGAGTRR